MIKSRFALPRFFTTAFVLFCVVSSANAQDKVLLRLNLHPGQTFDKGMMVNTETSEVIQNIQIHKTLTEQIRFHSEVLSVDNDGTVKLKTTFQSLATKETTTNNGKKVEPTFSYDSTEHSKVVPPSLQFMATTVGQNVILTISSRGEILKVEGVDAIVNKTGADIKVPFIRAMLKDAVKNYVDSISKQSVGMVIFAPPAIAVGDSWTEKISQSAFRPMQLNVKYTVISSKNGVATISILSPIKTSLTGTVNGTISVDEKTGLILSSELHQHLGDKPATTSKDVVHGKSKPMADSSFTVNSKTTMRRWTIKPLQ